VVLRRAGAAGLAGASFAGRGAGRGRGLTGACDGAGRGAGGAALRVLAVRGERFYCLGEPRRKTWGAGCAARARGWGCGGARLGVGDRYDESGAVRMGGKSRS